MTYHEHNFIEAVELFPLHAAGNVALEQRHFELAEYEIQVPWCA